MPAPAQSEDLCDLIESLSLGKDEAIGIHCTHGINRTGYAVIYLLMTRDKRNLTLTQAFAIFEQARLHRMMKDVLIKDLF